MYRRKKKLSIANLQTFWSYGWFPQCRFLGHTTSFFFVCTREDKSVVLLFLFFSCCYAVIGWELCLTKEKKKREKKTKKQRRDRYTCTSNFLPQQKLKQEATSRKKFFFGRHELTLKEKETNTETPFMWRGEKKTFYRTTKKKSLLVFMFEIFKNFRTRFILLLKWKSHIDYEIPVACHRL